MKNYVQIMKTALEASLDAVCILDGDCRIIYLNPILRSLMGLRGREVAKKPIFCDKIVLTACKSGCKLEESLKKNEILRLDETPAEVNGNKIRLLLKALPIPAQPGKTDSTAPPIGMIVSVRDTTAEILVQAKYHKLKMMVEERDMKLVELQNEIKALRDSYRFRGSS